MENMVSILTRFVVDAVWCCADSSHVAYTFLTGNETTLALATRIDGVFYIPVYGGNGNIMMYVGENGSVAAQYDYDPYGNIFQATGPLASQLSFGFSTKYHDREVNLVAYQLRTYDPLHGRWLNRDPIEERGGENLYGFVGNCPQFKVDMFGENVFSSAFPPLGGYNAPPYVVRQPESIDTSLSEVLLLIMRCLCCIVMGLHESSWSLAGMMLICRGEKGSA